MNKKQKLFALNLLLSLSIIALYFSSFDDRINYLLSSTLLFISYYFYMLIERNKYNGLTVEMIAKNLPYFVLILFTILNLLFIKKYYLGYFQINIIVSFLFTISNLYFLHKINK